MFIVRHKLLDGIQELLENIHCANEDCHIPIPDPSIYNAMSIAAQNKFVPDADTYFLENAEKMNEVQRIFLNLFQQK